MIKNYFSEDDIGPGMSLVRARKLIHDTLQDWVDSQGNLRPVMSQVTIQLIETLIESALRYEEAYAYVGFQVNTDGHGNIDIDVWKRKTPREGGRFE